MLFPDTKEIRISAWFLGDRIDLRALEHGETVALAPLTVRAGERGYAAMFRYGAVVFINLQPLEEAAFVETLSPFIHGRVDEPENETTEIIIGADHQGRIDEQGRLMLREGRLEHLQIVAHALAKSAVLAYYEERLAAIFDRVERLAANLQYGARGPNPGRELLRQIGSVLVTQTRMIGHVEVTEKPDMVWEEPELDRLYERLSSEYELRERDLALGRKLDLIARTAQTYLDLLQNRRSLRVEWYIVILIVVEIVIILFDMFWSH